MNHLRVCIVGLGMIGGSLGLAFKQGFKENLEIIGVAHSKASLEGALACGAVDRAELEISAGVREADVIIFCTPVLKIPGLVKAALPFLKSGAVLSDVGSTKGFLVEQIVALLPPDVYYIGGHPMAGSEKSGISAADGNLFRDKYFILTPHTNASQGALELIARLAGSTGAKVRIMDVENHDRCAAVISHVPHVAASAMVNLLQEYPGHEERFLELAGGGFCDTTRIASSNADMWADICLTNSPAIAEGLCQLQQILDEVIQSMRCGDRTALHTFFSTAKTRRDGVIESLLTNNR